MEDFPKGTVWEAKPYVQGSQNVYVQVVYQGSTSLAFLENETSGVYTSVPFSTPDYSGEYAAYIYESVGVTSGLGYPSGWGTVTFHSCQLALSNGAGGLFYGYPTTKVVQQYGPYPWDYIVPSSINQSLSGFSVSG